MPIKSKAQRRKFAELLLHGDITPEAFERWNREAGSTDLSEHVTPKTRKPAHNVTSKREKRARKKRSTRTNG